MFSAHRLRKSEVASRGTKLTAATTEIITYLQGLRLTCSYHSGLLGSAHKKHQVCSTSAVERCRQGGAEKGDEKLDTLWFHGVIYSGLPEDHPTHVRGVGIIMSKISARSLKEWEPISERIIMARFTSRCQDTTIIQAYAPTNDASEADKELFYEQLQATMAKRKKRDTTILMGDMNAKVGSADSGNERVMGRHGVGTMNHNGELFVDFCAMNDLVIGGTLFPHKESHKVTWRSPDGSVENQIDHIAISRRWRGTLQDCRIKRSADVGSDHHLLLATCRIRLAACRKKIWKTTKFNVEKLKNPETKQEFLLTLANRYDALRYNSDEEEEKGDDEGIETEWSIIKKAYTSTCEDVLGKIKREKKEWMSQDTWEKVKERRSLKANIDNSRTRNQKANAMKLYNEADRKVKRNCRRDKRKWILSLATEAEEAASKHDMKTLYKITKTLGGRRRQINKPVKDKEGKLLATKEQQMERWREHFKEILNRLPPSDPPEIEPQTEMLDIQIEPPSKAEIHKAIRSLKNGKAAGPDGIPPEAWKEAGSLSVEALHPLLNRIWQEEKIPIDWRKGTIIKLPKKGDLSQCKNWRGITLLSVASKVLCKIILNRITNAMEPKFRDNQAGFRPNRSCSDQIATLRIILEQSTELNSQLYAIFVDYEKAFDSVDRTILWKILAHYGIHIKIINMIKVFYTNFQAQVSHEGDLTEPFNMSTGVRQGCLLSPLLFITALDWVMRETTKEGRTGIQWTLRDMLDDLDFADDLALLSHSISQMKEKMQKLERISSQVGLVINATKTKEMRVKTTGKAKPVCCRGIELETVKEFTYLGSVISNDGGATKDVEARIGKAKAAFAQLKPVWRARSISLKTKLRILESSVKSILLYGCETWGLTQLNIKKLQTFINSRLRFILGIWWPRKISNQDLLEKVGQEPVEITIRRRKWRWIGHTLRKPPASITRAALEWNPQGKRRRGRPRLSWRRGVIKDLTRANTSWQEVKKTTHDRKRWRHFTEALCSRRGEED
ncbi:uncharacterized protein [Paramisgurnus dabryanus]|uniref:uncharacterized protein n=1 Tax=Paramisgurnus dabryanus TaxID=90735 RepID=UPI003CCF217D